MSISHRTSDDNLAIPLGSQVLVTGATGFIASHIIQEALSFGYKVRATVRSQSKANLTTTFFNHPNFDAHLIEDLTDDDAIDDAVKGCVGIIHVASNTTLSANPELVIPPTVAIAVALLQAAQRVGTCERFVYTSSASAVTIPKPDTKLKITKDMWNDDSVMKAESFQPPYDPRNFYHVYAASKTLAERAVWKFVKDQKPKFTVNVVVPNTNIGKPLFHPPTSSANFAIAVLNGKINFGTHANWYINVGDCAKIHLAALIDKSLQDDRIFAYAEPFHWNDMLEAVRKARPNTQSLPLRLSDQGRDLTVVDNRVAKDMLWRWFKQEHFKSLNESVLENLDGFGKIQSE